MTPAGTPAVMMNAAKSEVRIVLAPAVMAVAYPAAIARACFTFRHDEYTSNSA
jgi:hypothetical protein